MSEHECIICGNMHDPERAEQAERALAEATHKNVLPCPEGHAPHGQPGQCLQCLLTTLRATLARVEETNEKLRNVVRIDAEDIDRLTAERDTERERADSNFATYSTVAAERDGLRAFIEANFHKTTLEIINEREDLKEIIGDLLKRSDGLRSALKDAPDMTCESPEARAWREKHAAALGRIVNNDPIGGV